MKVINFKRFFIVLTFTLALMLTAMMSVNAKTYLSRSVGGSHQKTGYVKLGEGLRYLKAKATYESGSAYAYKIVKWAPDDKVATVSNVVKGKGEKSDDFYAIATAKNGANQSYYIVWKGTQRSSADVRFTD